VSTVPRLDLGEELIVVSGGEGALGRAICERLAELGATVVSVDVALTKELSGGGSKFRYGADVSDPSEVEAMLAAVCERLGRPPSTVCCHAGIVSSYPVLEYPLTAFDELIRVNVRGAFVLAQAAARLWKATGARGHLVFTSSWVQDYPWPGIAPYCASKAALHALMRSFAKELAPFGIRANAVLPGIAAVGMARKQWDEDPEYRRRAGEAIALGRLQEPASVADAFAFLCSPLASYMTGSALRVDGGCSLGPL
jgi:NAD(P)-dependent dehydrogenase (short-subunit alcohol dehydrogenase family)